VTELERHVCYVLRVAFVTAARERKKPRAGRGAAELAEPKSANAATRSSMRVPNGYYDVLTDVVLFRLVEFRDPKRAFIAACRVELGDVADLNVVLVFQLSDEFSVHLSFSVCLVITLNQKSLGVFPHSYSYVD
jgi:hypothetical protein